MTLMCCYQGCEKPAEFACGETTRRDPDNETHACADHLGHLLGTTLGFPDCHHWWVAEIAASSAGKEQR